MAWISVQKGHNVIKCMKWIFFSLPTRVVKKYKIYIQIHTINFYCFRGKIKAFIFPFYSGSQPWLFCFVLFFFSPSSNGILTLKIILFLKVILVTSRIAAFWEYSFFFPSHSFCPFHAQPSGPIFSVMQIGQLFTFFLSLNSTSSGTQMHFGSHSCRKITGNLMNLQVILQKCFASFANDVWPPALLHWCKFLSCVGLVWSVPAVSALVVHIRC